MIDLDRDKYPVCYVCGSDLDVNGMCPVCDNLPEDER